MPITSTEPFTIKTAQLKDLQDISTIVGDYFFDTDEAYFLKHIEDTLAGTNPDKSEHYCIVKDEEKNICAYLGYRNCSKKLLEYTFTAKPMELYALFVSKDSQHHGIGSKLVHFLKQKAAEKRYTEVILKSQAKFKDSSWDFYEKMGFEKIDLFTEDSGNQSAIFRIKL